VGTSLSTRFEGDRASIRVGTDLCSVADVAESVATFGDRYLQRVYTEDELEYCGRDPARSAERLAARFAAKEAALKVLRPLDSRPEWRAIEVRRDPAGWCELSLTGSAARLAREAGITSLSVSLSHEAGLANAVVVATLPGPPEPSTTRGGETGT
jgi:holo-[acyl-carrier protein] synthase